MIPQALEAGLALSGPMTSVSLGGSYYLPLVGSFSDTSLVTMNVSQTIWDGYPGGTQKATVEKSLLSLRAKQLTTDSDRASFVYDVKQAYLTLLSSQRTIAAKRDILAKQESSLAQMEVSFKLQHATAVDFRPPRSTSRAQRLTFETEQNMLREARIIPGQPDEHPGRHGLRCRGRSKTPRLSRSAGKRPSPRAWNSDMSLRRSRSASHRRR